MRNEILGKTFDKSPDEHQTDVDKAELSVPKIHYPKKLLDAMNDSLVSLDHCFLNLSVLREDTRKTWHKR